MLEIILIRHGETDGNKNLKFIGSTDISINSKGSEQACRLPSILKEDKISRIYSSDLKRCLETAGHINCDNIESSRNLREMDFGHWEGLNYSEIKEKYPEEIDQWENDWVTYCVPEGESFMDMSKRVLAEFDRILHTGSDEKIAIVSHGGCIRTILGQYIIGSLKECWKFHVENAAVSRLVFNKDYIYLKSLNER